MSILNRTAYFDISGGVVRFLDWATVTTTLGGMTEPHFHQRTGLGDEVINFDFEDEIARIDELKIMDARQQNQLLSGGDHALIGGHVHPRIGR